MRQCHPWKAQYPINYLAEAKPLPNSLDQFSTAHESLVSPGIRTEASPNHVWNLRNRAINELPYCKSQRSLGWRANSTLIAGYPAKQSCLHQAQRSSGSMTKTLKKNPKFFNIFQDFVDFCNDSLATSYALATSSPCFLRSQSVIDRRIQSPQGLPLMRMTVGE